MRVNASFAPRSIARCVRQITNAVSATNSNIPIRAAEMPASETASALLESLRQNPTTPQRLKALALVTR